MHTAIALLLGLGIWIAAFKLRSIPRVDRAVERFWALLGSLLYGRK